MNSASAASDLSPAATPGIFNLHNDVLLHIFHLNTYTPETEYSIHSTYTPSDYLSSPLTVAHRTSQVCHVWRQAILTSPTIWGSLIDVTILESSSKLWTEEVLKRTSESALSIYGRVPEGPGPSFFHSLLKDNWHRVRRLDVYLVNLTPVWGDTWLWSVISGRLAPRLEKFLLRGISGGIDAPPGENDGPRVIAPSLRRYHCPIAVHAHRESWLPQLLSLTLSYSLSISDIHRILGTTVHLESLIITDPPVSTSRTDWNKIYLPRLVRLHISGTVSQCLHYLQNIVGHPDCALVLHVKDLGEDFSVERNDLLLEAITPYTARYFDIQRPPRLMIDVESAAFKFQSIKSTDMMYFAHPETSLFYNLSNARTFGETALTRERILSALSTISLGSVVELEVNSDRLLWIYLKSSPGLLGLMESLSTSVHTLIVSPNSFRLLNNVNPDRSSHVLPLLRVIQLYARESFGFHISPYLESFPEDLLRFFSRRKAAGLPVLKLEISDVVMPYLEYDWRFLDAIEGLKVIWKRNSEEFEYTCGSGEKERLNWSKNMGDRTSH